MRGIVGGLLAVSLFALPAGGGCDRTVSERETVTHKRDGATTTERETVKVRPDGTRVHESEKVVDR